MSTTANSSDGTLSGTNEVIIVPSPPSGSRKVTLITVSNRDTASIFLSVQLANGRARRVIWQGTLCPNDTWVFGEKTLVLDSNTKYVIARLGGTVATTQPDFISSWEQS
jgi:hypothetical protein